MSYREMDFVNDHMGRGSGDDGGGAGWEHGDGHHIRSNSNSTGDYYVDTTLSDRKVDPHYGVGEEFKWFAIWMVMAFFVLVLPFCCNSAYRSKLCFYLWRPCGRVALVNPSSDEDEEGQRMRRREHIDAIFHAAVVRTDRRQREHQLKLDQAKAARAAEKRQLLEGYLKNFTINLAPPTNLIVCSFANICEFQSFGVSSSSLNKDSKQLQLVRNRSSICSDSFASSSDERHDNSQTESSLQCEISNSQNVEQTSISSETLRSRNNETFITQSAGISEPGHVHVDTVGENKSKSHDNSYTEEVDNNNLSQNSGNSNDGIEKHASAGENDESRRKKTQKQTKEEHDDDAHSQKISQLPPEQVVQHRCRRRSTNETLMFLVPLPGMSKQEADHRCRMAEAHNSFFETKHQVKETGAADPTSASELLDHTKEGENEKPMGGGEHDSSNSTTICQMTEELPERNVTDEVRLVKGEEKSRKTDLADAKIGNISDPHDLEAEARNDGPGAVLSPASPPIKSQQNTGDRLMEGFSTSEFLRKVPTTCAICLDRYKRGDEVCWSPNEECSHVFHKECIVDWLISRKSRHSLQEDTLEEILQPSRSLEESVREAPMTCPCCRHKFICSSRPSATDHAHASNDQ